MPSPQKSAASQRETGPKNAVSSSRKENKQTQKNGCCKRLARKQEQESVMRIRVQKVAMRTERVYEKGGEYGINDGREFAGNQNG